jgi:hypothetical protein
MYLCWVIFQNFAKLLTFEKSQQDGTVMQSRRDTAFYLSLKKINKKLGRKIAFYRLYFKNNILYPKRFEKTKNETKLRSSTDIPFN